jgi:hypothetical protein
MSIVDFNDRMREYGDTLRFLQVKDLLMQIGML